jgi:hypothetical protein
MIIRYLHKSFLFLATSTHRPTFINYVTLFCYHFELSFIFFITRYVCNQLGLINIIDYQCIFNYVIYCAFYYFISLLWEFYQIEKSLRSIWTYKLFVYNISIFLKLYICSNEGCMTNIIIS